MKLYLLVLLVAMYGCATTANIQPEEVRIDRTEGQLIPVRAFLNRQQPVPRFYMSRLDAVEAALKESGAFFDVGSHVDSPIILDIQLDRGTSDGALHSAGHILSAATLFLVPTKVNNFNELKVDVYAYGRLLKTYEFRQEYSQLLGLHNYNEVASNQDNEFLSIRNLVNQFVNAIVEDGILPRILMEDADTADPENVPPPLHEARNSLRPDDDPSIVALAAGLVPVQVACLSFHS